MPDTETAIGWDRYAYSRHNPIKYNDPTGHFWWVVAGFGVGAAISYGTKVYQNYQNGVSKPWTDVDPVQLIGGGLIGAGTVLCAPATVGLAGDALVGTALITGSTTLFMHGTSLYQTATVIEANIAYGAPFRPISTFNYDPIKHSEIIAHDYQAQSNGMPNTLTYSNDKGLHESNRHRALAGMETRTGFASRVPTSQHL